ncbi:MAG: SRPBCC family protein [Puniceicoccaceae bacterium]
MPAVKLKTEQQYNASAAELWQIIHDPGTMPAYNAKCVSSESLARFETGQTFAVKYEMNGKMTDAVGELVGYETESMVHFRYTYEDGTAVGNVDEIFQIIPSGERRCRVVHILDLSNSTLPRWAKIVVGFISRFGKSQGGGPLDGIAELLE